MIYDILKHTFDAIVVLDLHKEEILFMNSQCQQILGVREETMEFPMKQFFFKSADREEIKKQIEESLEKEDVFFLEDIEIYSIHNIQLNCQIKGGYFDEANTQIYLTFFLQNHLEIDTNYIKIADDIPTGIAVLGFNERLPLYYANKACFELLHTTSTSFEHFFENNFIHTLRPEMREIVVKELELQLLKTNKCFLEVEVFVVDAGYQWMILEGVLSSQEQSSTMEIRCAIRPLEAVNYVTKSKSEETLFFDALQTLTTDTLFRLNLQTGSIHYMGNLKHIFQQSYTSGTFPQYIVDANIIPKEDIANFLIMSTNMLRGIEEPTYFRIHTEDGKKDWYLAEYIILRNQHDMPIEAIGKIMNVQKQKDLEKLINIDPLTQCLNKKAFEDTISKMITLKNTSMNATFMIVDIDNFKAINDNLGHLFGDVVLKEVSEKLRNIFRDTDYIGRIGGDEFTVFIKNIADDTIIIKKANEIISAFDRVYEGKNGSYRITCSIGIAKYPKDGISYKAIYSNADVALYHAKNSGKNSFTFYNENLTKGTMGNIIPIEMTARSLWQNVDQNLVMMVSKLLFQQTDIEISMQEILACMGAYCNIDEVYLIETHDKGESYQKKYEWKQKELGIEELDCFAYTPLVLWENFLECSAEENVFYCADLNTMNKHELYNIMKENKVLSFFYAHTKTTEYISYMLGFNVYHEVKIWKPTEISTLIYITKLIGQFLHYIQNIES